MTSITGSVSDFKSRHEEQLLHSWIDLDFYNSQDRNLLTEVSKSVENVASKVNSFYEQLPEISDSDSRTNLSLEMFDKIALILHQVENSSSADIKGFSERVNITLRSALEALAPGMNQLAEAHPSVAEAGMLQSPEIFYSCFNLTKERLSHLQNKDFLFEFARRLERYSANNNLPSRLYELREYLVNLDKDELKQLGAMINRENDRKQFAEIFVIDNQEEAHQLFLQTDKELEQTIGFNGGICWGFTISLIGQEIPDPTALNVEKMKYIQNFSMDNFRKNSKDGLSKILPSMIPPEILQEMHLSAPRLVLPEQPICKLVNILDTCKEGRFILGLENHAIFISLTDKMYCDLNDYHIITGQPRIRKFDTNAEMLAALTRYLHIRYAGRQTEFSLIQADRT